VGGDSNGDKGGMGWGEKLEAAGEPTQIRRLLGVGEERGKEEQTAELTMTFQSGGGATESGPTQLPWDAETSLTNDRGMDIQRK